MDTAQWPQEIGGLVKPMEEMVPSGATAATGNRPPQMMERRARPQKEQALNCPRCNSTNTKFCYYNNYSLTQPRYFCKACRRYWTEGGSLRNVPVGGGSRKNKRSSSSGSSSSSLIPTTNINTHQSSLTNPSTTTNMTASTAVSSRILPPDLTPPPISLSSSSLNPKFHEGQDLNLAFPHQGLPEFGDFQAMESRKGYNNNNSSSSSSNTRNCSIPSTASGALSAMELLRSGMSTRGLGQFMMPMPMPMPEAGAVYPSGFGLQNYRPPTLSFPLDGIGGTGGGGGGGGSNGYENLQGVQEGGGRLLFPFEDLKPVPTSSTDQFEQNRGQGGDPPAGFWNGMIGGGGSW